MPKKTNKSKAARQREQIKRENIDEIQQTPQMQQNQSTVLKVNHCKEMRIMSKLYLEQYTKVIQAFSIPVFSALTFLFLH